MTMLYADTCWYGSDAGEGLDVGWDAGSVLSPATGGPFGGRYYLLTILNRTLGVNATTLYCGFWYQQTATANANVARFKDGATTQVTLAWEVTTNKLKVLNGDAGTQLGITSSGLTLTAWVFIEWKVVFGASGSTIVKVDGTEVINVTSVDTTATANNYANLVNLSATGSVERMYGESYILDDQGSLNNTFLGPVRGYLLSPTGDGTHTSWTPNTGTRWQAVDETPTPDDDTTYISDNTATNKNSVTLTNTAASLGTIHCVMDYTRARRDDAGPHTFRSGLRVTGTDYPNATETLTASYVGYNYLRQVSPATSAAWTASELDAMDHLVETVS